MELTGQDSARRPGRGPAFLIGLGLVLLLAASSWLVLDRQAIDQGAGKLPARLAGLPLSEQLSDRPALAKIGRLHGQDFSLVDGAVARYGDSTATVWVSSTRTTSLAAQQVQAMTGRISEGRSPFTPLGRKEVEGITVYSLTGMGQRHYYFQLERRVVWLAVTAELADQALGELIRYLQ